MGKLAEKLGFVKKLQIIFDEKEKKEFIKVFVLDVFMGIFQSISIVSVFAFINTVMDVSTISSNKYLSFFYENLGFSDIKKFLFVMGLAVLILLISGNVISAYSTWLKTFFVWNVNCKITTKLLRKYLFSPYAYFLNRNTSELEKNITSECDALSGNFLQSFLNMMEGLITTLIILIMLLLTDPLVTVISMGTLITLYLLIYLRFSKMIKSTGRQRIEENRDRYKAVTEALHGVKYTKVVRKEGYFLNEYIKHAEKFSTLQAKNSIIGKIPKFLMEVIAFGGLIGVVLLSLSSRGNIENIISSIALFGFSGYRLLPALQSIYDSYTVFKFNKPVLDKISGDLSEGNLIRENSLSQNTGKQIRLKGKIILENISFSYEGNRSLVLEDINLEIEKNSSIALVGPTGSGKTTLVDILLGLLTPSSGEIIIDGTKITEENIRSWQKSLGYVPQDIYLCDDTVAKNIGFGLPAERVDMEQVKKVAKMANISDFIENELPEKYNTAVGERGVRLSGGQRQRIGIARALYHNPDILILDEATSSLDSITEKSVLEAIEKVSKLKTMIIIAHRLTTVEKCNKIYLLDKGHIIAEGNYNELMKNNEKFREMSKSSKQLHL